MLKQAICPNTEKTSSKELGISYLLCILCVYCVHRSIWPVNHHYWGRFFPGRSRSRNRWLRLRQLYHHHDDLVSNTQKVKKITRDSEKQTVLNLSIVEVCSLPIQTGDGGEYKLDRPHGQTINIPLARPGARGNYPELPFGGPPHHVQRPAILHH